MGNYQIWGQYKVQNSTNPRGAQEWVLMYTTDELESLYDKQKQLEAEDMLLKQMVTKEIEVIADFTEESAV